MQQTKRDTVSVSATGKILRLLSGLRKTESGAIIYQHIERIVSDVETTHASIEQAYAGILCILLDAHAQQLPSDSTLPVRIRLLKTHLTPPLVANELVIIRNYVQSVAEQLKNIRETDQNHLEKVLEPLLEEFGITTAAPVDKTEASEIVPFKSVIENKVNTEPPPEPAAPAITTAPQNENEETSPPEQDQERADPPSAENRIAQTYRQHLNEKHAGIQRLQSTLAAQVTDTIKQNDHFGQFLESQLNALGDVHSVNDLNRLKRFLIAETERMLQGQRSLATRLDDTHNYLAVVKDDGKRLREELTRVHLLSLTDDLTGLPNRRAFLRRLEDEVARVQRYGSPLSLSVIDIDGFKSINDQHGHAAGDEVLRCFARDILSIFRHHDLVSRYGGEEFVVLLPNTDQQGAYRALEKVQKRAAENTYQFSGKILPIPTFSAGLAVYTQGETAMDLIKRADEALYRAKNLGRNRIEFADERTGAGDQTT